MDHGQYSYIWEKIFLTNVLIATRIFCITPPRENKLLLEKSINTEILYCIIKLNLSIFSSLLLKNILSTSASLGLEEEGERCATVEIVTDPIFQAITPGTGCGGFTEIYSIEANHCNKYSFQPRPPPLHLHKNPDFSDSSHMHFLCAGANDGLGKCFTFP